MRFFWLTVIIMALGCEDLSSSGGEADAGADVQPRDALTDSDPSVDDAANVPADGAVETDGPAPPADAEVQADGPAPPDDAEVVDPDGPPPPPDDAAPADEGVAPTCDDGIQNGDEEGVDCGGACEACPEPATVSVTRAGARPCNEAARAAGSLLLSRRKL